MYVLYACVLYVCVFALHVQYALIRSFISVNYVFAQQSVCYSFSELSIVPMEDCVCVCVRVFAQCDRTIVAMAGHISKSGQTTTIMATERRRRRQPSGHNVLSLLAVHRAYSQIYTFTRTHTQTTPYTLV